MKVGVGIGSAQARTTQNDMESNQSRRSVPTAGGGLTATDTRRIVGGTLNGDQSPKAKHYFISVPRDQRHRPEWE